MPASCIRRIAIAAISGVCSAGLAMTAVARDERRRDLAGEDREREIPRADADEHAAPAMVQLVGLAGRPRHRFRHQRAPRLRRVIAAEVDRLAHFRHRIVERLAAFRLQASRARRRGSARRDRRRAPARPRARRPALRSRRQIRPRRRRAPPRRVSPLRLPQRRGAPHAGEQRLQARAVAELHAGRVLPLRPRTDRAAAGCADGARGLRPRSTPAGAAGSSATGTDGSAATDTNDEFAPFSSSRRTR